MMKPVGRCVVTSMPARAPDLRGVCLNLYTNTRGDLDHCNVSCGTYDLEKQAVWLQFRTMKDTAWLREKILARSGSLVAFATDMRTRGHSLMTAGVLDAALAGRADLWNEEAALIARLLDASLFDVLASLCLARIDHRFAFPEEDARLELAS